MHWECKYCDGGFRAVCVDGDYVCPSCGAEWEGAKILVEDEEYEEDDFDDNDDWIDDEDDKFTEW